MAAKQSALGELHAFLAEQFLIELKWYRDNDIPVPAADKAAAAKFLKDNNITCDPADKSDLEALREQFMAESNARRSKAAELVGMTKEDLIGEYGLN